MDENAKQLLSIINEMKSKLNTKARRCPTCGSLRFDNFDHVQALKSLEAAETRIKNVVEIFGTRQSPDT